MAVARGIVTSLRDGKLLNAHALIKEAEAKLAQRSAPPAGKTHCGAIGIAGKSTVSSAMQPAKTPVLMELN